MKPVKSNPSAKLPRLEVRQISELLPNEKNPRRVSAAAIGRLTKSLAAFGNLSPITFNVSTGKVLGGHQRLKCLAASGRTETECWCVELPPEKEAAAMLALNNHAGEWDDDGLELLLREIDESGIDRDLTGFNHEQITKLLGEIDQSLSQGDAPAIAEQFQILVECQGEQQQSELLMRFTEEGFKCKALIS